MDGGTASSPRWMAAAAVAVLRNPSLWSTALRQMGRLAAPGWWRRPPHLPVPSAAYLEFRLETQYGAAPSPDPRDIVTYLRWCRSFPHGR